MNKQSLCPCGSRRTYGQCCAPWHEGRRPAPTAEALMRSRYVAFALGLADYLVATHHPDFREPDERKALQQGFRGVRWLGLEVLATAAGGEADDTGEVEFRARYRARDAFHALHERSRFSRVDGRWMYRDGDLFDEDGD